MNCTFVRATLIAGLLVTGGAGAYAQSATSPVYAKPKTDLAKPEETAGKATDPATTGNPAISDHFSTPNGGMSSGAHNGNESPTKKGNSANGQAASEPSPTASQNR